MEVALLKSSAHILRKIKHILHFRSSDLIPEFGEGFSNNVTVQRESTAFLNCPVKNPGDRPVSYPLVSMWDVPARSSIIQNVIYRYPGSVFETGIF